MLDKNTALLWILENTQTRKFTAVMVTENAYVIGNGHLDTVGKAAWRGYTLEDAPRWQATVMTLTEMREGDGYQLIMADTVPVSISHHRDIEKSRRVASSSAALSFTVSSNLNRLRNAGLRSA